MQSQTIVIQNLTELELKEALVEASRQCDLGSHVSIRRATWVGPRPQIELQPSLPEDSGDDPYNYTADELAEWGALPFFDEYKHPLMYPRALANFHEVRACLEQGIEPVFSAPAGWHESDDEVEFYEPADAPEPPAEARLAGPPAQRTFAPPAPYPAGQRLV